MSRLDLGEPLWAGSRFQWSQAVKPGGDRVELTPPPQFEVGTSDAEAYTTHAGDRLDQLAFDLLGDSRLWWVLADLNRALIPDSLFLTPGITLTIPTLKAVGGLS